MNDNKKMKKIILFLICLVSFSAHAMKLKTFDSRTVDKILNKETGAFDAFKAFLNDVDVNATSPKDQEPLLTRIVTNSKWNDARADEILKMVHFLLHQNVNINATDKFGLSALDHAVSEGELTEKLLKTFLEQKNLEFERKQSALDWAIYSGNPRAVKLLINAGANPNITTKMMMKSDSTPLQYAQHRLPETPSDNRYYKKHVEIIDEIADFNSRIERERFMKEKIFKRTPSVRDLQFSFKEFNK